MKFHISALLLCLALAVAAPAAAQDQDRLITVDTRGNHTSVSIVLNPTDFNRGYIVYTYGPKNQPATQVMVQQIKYSEKIDNWQFREAPKIIFDGSVEPALNRKREVSNAVAAIDAETLSRVHVTWSDVVRETSNHRIMHSRLAPNADRLGGTKVVSQDTRTMFNGAIVRGRNYQLATYSRYANNYGQNDAGLLINHLNPNKRKRFGETVLIDSYIGTDSRTGNLYPSTTFCIDSFGGDQCGVVDYDQMILAVNEILPDTYQNGNHWTRGGVINVTTRPNGQINLEDTYWFFNQTNIESLFQIVDDGSPGLGTFWVFAAGTANVEYQITVSDVENEEVKQYFNPLNAPSQAVLDTSAFATCPQAPAATPADITVSNWAVSYNKQQGRFIVQKMNADGTSLVGKKYRSRVVGKNIGPWVADYKDGHILIAFVRGTGQNNKLRLYDMEVEEK